MEEKELGRVLVFLDIEDFPTVLIKLDQTLKVGDTIKVKFKGGVFYQKVDFIQERTKHGQIDEAYKGQTVAIRVVRKLTRPIRIYKAG